MSSATDDNFFIEEPLKNNFFNKDIQMVELLRHKRFAPDTSKNFPVPTNTRSQSRYTYYMKLKENTIDNSPNASKAEIETLTATSMPKSYITKLELLCKAICDTDDIEVAKHAVEALTSASKNGCRFLEKYMVILLKFCTKNHHKAHDNSKIEIEKMLDRVLNVDFDRQQLTENLRKPELKLNSIDQILQLIRRVQDMLDYQEHVAICWLSAILDAHFVELATNSQVDDIIDQISAQIDSRSKVLRETGATKTMLDVIFEQFDGDSNHKKDYTAAASINRLRHLRSNYKIDLIEL